MSESAAKRTSSSLAITERKGNGQKPGGFVGIFFRLFDWNRRLSKKKLSPKKLLLPARAKVSKKFNADEKVPVGKHLLIAAAENNGGFPSKVKKNADNRITSEPKKQQMQAPGLVARLMGLEAMPAPVPQTKSNEGSGKDECKGKEERLGGGSDKVDCSPEKGNLRPQKIQKIGVSERKPITRFGVEGLQIKNVLSKSRKLHQPKLASPVKSPKLGQNMSRLIDTAARILEPGVQAGSRARNSLTYSNPKIGPPKEDVMTEAKVMDMDLQLDSRTPCRSCGNFVECLDTRPIAQDKIAMFDVPASNFRELFLHSLEERKPRPTVYLENETEVVLLKTRYQPDYVTTRAGENRLVETGKVRNTVHQSCYHNQIPTSRTFTSQKDLSPSLSLNQVNQRHSQISVGDRIPPRSKVVNAHARRVSTAGNTATESQDFIALNQNISQTRVRVPNNSDIKIERNRTFCKGKNVTQTTQRSPIRKRTLNLSRSVDTTDSAASLYENWSNKANVMAKNGPRIRTNSVNQTNIKSRSVSQRGNRETDVVSFTFSSPVKSATRYSHNEMDVKTKDPLSQLCDDKLQDKIMTEENSIKKPSQNSLQMKGDVIGALLEQKLKELTNQAENEAASGFMPSARTTASILQELISALTAERPMSFDDEAHDPYTKDSQHNRDGVDRISQSKSRVKRSSDNLSCEVDHFSPGCILDASFSNESCISGSINDNSGCMLQPAFTDVDMLDSASSTNKTRSSNPIAVIDLLNHASSQLQNVGLVHAKLSGAKLNYVLRIISTAEVLFGNAARHSSSRFVDFLLGPFLDGLETLVIAAWKNSIILGMEMREEESPLRVFLFDCIIECLDVRFCQYSNSGFRAWSRLPKYVDNDNLVTVFDEEVRTWIALAGTAPDEIIERDMSTSLGKWTDFEIEAFETASQINEELVQTLVDEIVIDLIGSEVSFC